MTSTLRALVLLPFLAAGCVTTTVTKSQYANITAGAVGCPADEIKISGEKNTFGMGDQMTPWTAECRGHRFICSAGANPTCKEELQAAQAPAQAPAPAQAADTAQ
jgi:hypothetical protein